MAPVFVFLLVGILSSANAFTFPRAGCSLKVNGGLPSPQPLLLKSSGALDTTGFLDSDATGTININAGQKIIVACTGSNNYIPTLGASVTDVTATCVSGTTFSVNNKNYDISNLACNARPTHSAYATGRTCLTNGILVHIGFNATARGFYKTIEVCFDQRSLGPLYSHSTMVGGIGGAETGVPRPSWAAGSFYGTTKPDTQYARANQIATIGQLLGSQALGQMYVSTTSDYYLARGHLVAKADFVYGVQHYSTFYYVNAAPQWQTFNGGNWNTLEQNVRKYVSNTGLDLEVYTGTHGVSTLPDINGKDVELYLDTNKVMPIPQFFWKIVYNPSTRAAIVFVGINNPYVAIADRPALRLCTDVCSRVSWLTWDRTSVKKGEGYCCEYSALRSIITNMPSLTVTQLLV